MTHIISAIPISFRPGLFDLRLLVLASIFLVFGVAIAFAQEAASPVENNYVIDDAPDMDVFSYGKTVVVKKRAKGVLVFGGDVIVEGSVSGDVAAIAGSVIQREGAYIGGDVIVFGGKYKPDVTNPLREEGKETVMYAGYEEELRGLVDNPSSLFSPQISLVFLAQRLLSVLFWFAISLGLTTIAPGAVSRAIARFHLSTLKVVAIGAAAFLAMTIGVVGGLQILPNYLGVLVSMMALVLVMLAYVFGRVALHLTVGKLIQKYMLGDKSQSEALAILMGVTAWTLLLSIPYVWTLALFVLFSAGIGLVLTARSHRTWQTS